MKDFKWNIGDIVMLKSGGPAMVVAELSTDNAVQLYRVFWSDDDKHAQEATFDERMLSPGRSELDLAARADRAARYSAMLASHAAWHLLHHLWSRHDEPYVKDEWKRLEKAISDLGARPS